MIRLAAKDDLEAVLAIEQRAFVPGIRAETTKPFQDQLDHYPEGFVVLVEDGVVVGYATAIPIEYPTLARIYRPDVLVCHPPHLYPSDGHNLTDPTALYITSIACDRKPYTRRGSLIVDHFIREFRDRPILGVVNPKWVKAIELYGERGFCETATLSKFFHPSGAEDEDGILMMWVPE